MGDTIEQPGSEVNITLSGWTGAGTSTTTLLLANLLEREYLNLGDLFRDLGMRLGFANEGTDRPDADEYLESIIGRTVDKYVDDVLLHEKDIILESDIGAFRIGKHEKLVSVFLLADTRSRQARVQVDKREAGVEVLKIRDAVLKEKYQELWSIDVFDLELIRSKYTYVIDNSDLSIRETVQEVLDRLASDSRLAATDWNSIFANLDVVMGLIEQGGKLHLRSQLENKGLLRSTKQMMQEIANRFPEEVASYPDDIKQFFVSIR